MCSMRRLVVTVGSTVALLAVPAATAKDFQPGDLRMCGASECVVIENRDVLRALSSFLYMGAQPSVTWAPPLGARAYELRFSNDYATGAVASTRLDRFISYGVNIGRFGTRKWYRVPQEAAAEFRRLAATLTPLRVTGALLRKSP